MSDKGTILGHIAPINHDADGIDYDNTTSVLAATDVQAAIDELANDIYPWPTYLTDVNVKAWWKLDAMTGVDQFLDSSANVNDLTWGPVAALGTVVGSLYYRGFYFHNPGWPSINVLWRDISPSLQITTNLTADIIFKEEVKQNSSALISCMNAAQSVGWEVVLDTINIHFFVRTTTGLKHLTVSNFGSSLHSLNEWVHLRATYDGAFLRLYLLNYSRGQNFFTLVGSLAATGTIVYNTSTYNMFCLGARWFGTYGDLYSGHDHFEGILDQVAISDVIRTSIEGYQDVRPLKDVAVNFGNRLRRFDTIFAKNIIGVVENFDVARTVFVSPGFTQDVDTRRYQTLTAALAYVATQAPTAATPWLVYAYPGIYLENVVMLPYVGLQMPEGQITGSVTVVSNSLVNLDRVVSGALNGIAMLAAETGTAQAWANYVETTTAVAVLNQSSTTGVLMANVRQIYIYGSGLGVGDFTANGHMHIQIGDIYLWGNNSTGVISGGGAKPIVGSIDHILIGAPVNPRGIVVLSGGEVDVNVGELLVPTNVAYIVYGGGTLNLFVNTLSGSEVGAGGTVNVTKASHGTNLSNPHGTTFLQLPDTPAAYAASAGKAPIVNAGVNALVFQDVFAPTNTLFVSPQFTNDGVRKYTTITAAMAAAVAGNLILVYPGTYVESVTLKANVTLAGIDKVQVIIQQNNTGNPALRYTTFGTRDNIVTVANLTVIGYGTSKTFDFIYLGSGQWDYVNVTDVDFKTDSGTSYGQWDKYVYPIFTRCNFITSGGAGFAWKTTTTASVGTFNFCDIGGRALNQTPNALYFTDTRFYSIYATAGAMWLIRCSAGTDEMPAAPYNNFIHSNGCVVLLSNCILTSDGDFYPIRMEQNKTLEITDSRVQGVNGYTEIYCDVTVTSSTIKNNTLTTGLPDNLIHNNPIKYVGGGSDFYKTVQGALNGVTANGQKVVINSDQTITAALTPPSYAILIDGNNQFKITRSAGNPLMTLGDNDSVKFVNVDLVGSIDVAGNGAQLFLADHTFLTGMVDVQSGDANTLVKLDQCKVVGDATDLRCIRIADADPTIVVKRSSLKGAAGSPAIYWDGGVTNNNLKLAYTGVIHGSVGANVPFGRNAAQTPTVASHHDAFNADPFAATWTNSIGTPYDVVDVDADY